MVFENETQSGPKSVTRSAESTAKHVNSLVDEFTNIVRNEIWNN
jgi:hypothetical protein